MKKKILGVGIILILVVMLITLVGCGDKNTSTNTATNSVTDTNSNTDIDLNEENTISNNYSSTGESVAISKFICTFSGGIALVDSRGKQYIIDEKGNVLFDFSSEYKEAEKYQRTDEIVVRNGYVFNDSVVYDKNGKQTYHTTDGGTFNEENISKSGYFVISKSEEQFEGTVYTDYIMSPTGEVVTSHSGGSARDSYRCVDKDEDIFVYVVDGEYEQYINATTGKEIDILPNTVIGNTIANTVVGISSGGINTSDSSEVIQILNNEYFVGEFGLGGEKAIYKVEDKTNPERNPVKEFGESGLEYIIYYKDVYYVYSETGYLYTMDKNFNNITDPVKVDDIRGSGTFYLTSKGVLIEKDDNYVIIDEKLKEIEKLPSKVNGKLIERNFICVDANKGRHSYQETNFIYFADGSYYDINEQYYYEMINL